jgi:Domain of unknown function (DUF4214)
VETNFQTKASGNYHINDFMHLHDKAFVNAAYLAILRRQPDPAGAEYYSNRIRSGVSRQNILAQLLQSPEGRNYKTEIRGLSNYVLIDKFSDIPVLGGLVSGLHYLLSSKNRLKDMRALENHIYSISIQQPAKVTSNLIDQATLDFELNQAYRLTPRATEIYTQLKKYSNKKGTA